jgi:hypothetical protein
MYQYLSDFISSQLHNNQFLSGGAVLAVGGMLVAYLRNVPARFFNWCKRRIITEIDIPDRDEAFNWLCLWLANHPYKKRCRWWTVKTSRGRGNMDDDPCDRLERKKPTIILSPAPGLHYLIYKKRLMILYRERKDGGQDKAIANVLGYRETFHIKLFSRSSQLIFELLEEAQKLSHPDNEQRLRILTPDWGEWVEVSRRVPRSLNSVILENGIIQNLIDDVKQFLESEQWYSDIGIPYRRGYLLYGPPGNGKSSLVTAIASHFQLDICSLNLNSNGLNDEKLIQLMSSVPNNSLILIEDIDCVFKERKKVADKETITFSGLLNAIDGVLAGEGRLLFMTTNYRNVLDSALTRPGRVDIDVHIKNASKDQARKLYLRFFPHSEIFADTFANKLEGLDISMAQLQGHLLKYRANSMDAITQVIECATTN